MSCVACTGPTRPKTIGGNSLRVCPRCGSASLITGYQRRDYWGSSIDHISTFWTDIKARYFLSALELLEEREAGRRLLDVGGGVGHFAKLALDRGWDASSLDVSPPAADQAARLLGPDRAVQHLDEVTNGSCDVVTMWCVLAHVPDPSDLLTRAAGKLRPGGALWLTTPNFLFQRPYSRIRRRIGKPIDFADDDHIHHFTPRAIGYLGARAQLEPWTWHHRGITEFCALSSSSNRALLSAKRMWNRLAELAMRLGAPNLTSELQGLSTRAATSRGIPRSWT